MKLNISVQQKCKRQGSAARTDVYNAYVLFYSCVKNNKDNASLDSPPSRCHWSRSRSERGGRRSEETSVELTREAEEQDEGQSKLCCNWAVYHGKELYT